MTTSVASLIQRYQEAYALYGDCQTVDRLMMFVVDNVLEHRDEHHCELWDVDDPDYPCFALGSLSCRDMQTLWEHFHPIYLERYYS